MPHPPSVLVVAHQDDCGPAWFGTWLAEAGCELDLRRPHRGDPLPSDLGEHDGLIVLGGSMGAHDDEERDEHAASVAWLTPVKQLVRAAAAERVPTLGICLGHQLAAVALGGRVAPNPGGQRVGMTAIGWTPAAHDDPLVGPVAGGVAGPRRGVHWNGDVVVDEPPGTVALARTEDGYLQAARLAPTVWGVQLHPEADRQVVEPWAAGDAVRHAEQGLDQAEVLDEIGAAGDELRATWSPLAHRFAWLTGPRAAAGAR